MANQIYSAARGGNYSPPLINKPHTLTKLLVFKQAKFKETKQQQLANSTD